MKRGHKMRRPCRICGEWFLRTSARGRVCDSCSRRNFLNGIGKRYLVKDNTTAYKKAKLRQFEEMDEVHDRVLVCRLCGSTYGTDAKKDNGVCIYCCNKKT